MEDVAVTRLINGPEAFTPDGEFCLGETEVRGLFVPPGSARTGWPARAAWARRWPSGSPAASPSMDLWRWTSAASAPITARRPTRSRACARSTRPTTTSSTRTTSAGGPAAARLAGVRLAPRARRGVRREVGLGAGELVRVERGRGGRGAAAARLGRQALVAGHRGRAPACRERAALFDETSFAKIEVCGPGAAELLERLCDNRVAREVGRITYTQMLNSRGGIECDFTVARLAEDRFSIVTGTAFGRHDLSWIARHAPATGVRVRDVTSRWACSACGGRGRATCSRPLTPPTISTSRYMHIRDLAVGDVPVRALRVTYVGELGWELYCPMEYGIALWRTLWEAGEPHGVVAGGYRAIDSLRLEKGYRVWGADITPDETPYEAGLGFCVQADKELPRQARALDAEPARRLCCLTPRGSALGGAGERASARGRRDRRPRHQRRLRLHGRTLDRLRVSARRARRAGHGGGRRRSSASGSKARLPPSRCGIPRAPESASGPLVTC